MLKQPHVTIVLFFLVLGFLSDFYWPCVVGSVSSSWFCFQMDWMFEPSHIRHARAVPVGPLVALVALGGQLGRPSLTHLQEVPVPSVIHSCLTYHNPNASKEWVGCKEEHLQTPERFRT